MVSVRSFGVVVVVALVFGSMLLVARAEQREQRATQNQTMLDRIEALELEVEFLKRTIGVKTPDPAKPEHSVIKPGMLNVNPGTGCECGCRKCTCNKLLCDGKCQCGCNGCCCAGNCCEDDEDYAWEYGVGVAN